MARCALAKLMQSMSAPVGVRLLVAAVVDLHRIPERVFAIDHLVGLGRWLADCHVLAPAAERDLRRQRIDARAGDAEVVCTKPRYRPRTPGMWGNFGRSCELEQLEAGAVSACHVSL